MGGVTGEQDPAVRYVSAILRWIRNDVDPLGITHQRWIATGPFPQQAGDLGEDGLVGHPVRLGSRVGGRRHQPPQVLSWQRKCPEHAVAIEPDVDRVPCQGQVRVDIDEQEALGEWHAGESDAGQLAHAAVRPVAPHEPADSALATVRETHCDTVRILFGRSHFAAPYDLTAQFGRRAAEARPSTSACEITRPGLVTSAVRWPTRTLAACLPLMCTTICSTCSARSGRPFSAPRRSTTSMPLG